MITPVIISEELVITLSTDKPFLSLTLEQLYEKNIIPLNWKPLEPIANGDLITETKFTNGVRILVQSGILSFSEIFENKKLEDSAIPELACRYAKALSGASFQMVEINPSSFLRFDYNDEHKTSANPYIVSCVLNPDRWHQGSGLSIRGQISLLYTLEECEFKLEIEDVILPSTDINPEQSGILLYGNFLYDDLGDSTSGKLEGLLKHVSLCSNDIHVYRTIINESVIQ
jgi:hypothetical protein